jgi:hypothetical protein
MSTEQLILWATPANSTDAIDEKILSTQCSTWDEIERIKALAARDGWHSFRVQVIDGKLPDFRKGLR